jgi:hypothetical protein
MQRKLIPIWLILALLVSSLTYLFYSWGFTGIFQFDDEANLGWLQYANSWDNTLLFITSGNSGPLGRPIALISFYLLNGADWPQNASAFFHVNALIHILNGALILWLFTLLCPEKHKSHWFGLVVATLWLLHPMLVSTSLMAVQRMTSLSATFVLAGLLIYVKARKHIATKPSWALTGVTVAVGVFGTLAVFTKENGILLLGYILVLEYTLLRTNEFPVTSALRRWRTLILWLPSVSALIFLCWKLPEIAQSYSGRSYTLPERLQTEAVVLLDYIRLLILPARSELGPFRDDYPIYTSPITPPVLVAIGILASALALAIKYRKAWPYFSFAVLWFLVGHAMESTVIPLEIYFEHRNYLPSIGIVALIARLPWQVPQRVALWAKVAVLLYCLELAFVLGQTTTTWGKPMLAATLWHDEHPGSERAALMLAAEYSKVGDNQAILSILDTAASNRPNNMGLATSALYTICFLDNEKLFRGRLDNVLDKLQSSPLNFSAIDALEKLTTHRGTQCSWLTNEDIKRMTSAMLQNPQVISNHFVRARLHRINATLAWNEREFDSYVYELEQQFLANPQLATGIELVQSFLREGLWEAATEKLALVQARKPRHPLQRQLWENQLTMLQNLLDAKRD